jgi:hypothetical protein
MTRHARHLLGPALAGLLLAACAPVGGPGDAAALVAFTLAQNRGDPAAAADLFAPDGLYEGIGACSPVACVGRAAIAEAMEIEAGFGTSHLLHPRSPFDGGWTRDEVRWTTPMGPHADRIVADVAVEIGPSGITALRFVADPTDAQTASVLAWIARWREQPRYDAEAP